MFNTFGEDRRHNFCGIFFRSAIKLFSNVVLIILLTSNCVNEYYYESPEELTFALFEDLKRVHNYDNLLKLLKYGPERNVVINIIDHEDTHGRVNIEEHFLSLELQLTKWIIGNIDDIYPNPEEIVFQNDSITVKVKDCYDVFGRRASALIKTEDNFLEKKRFLESRWYPYDNLLKKFNEYIKKAKYISLTRGEKYEQFNRQSLWHSYINFIVDNEEKKLFIESLIKFENGWKVAVFDD